MNDDLLKLCEKVKENGYKLTPARKSMLESLLSASEHLITALELYDLIREKNKRVNFSTVYRNLEILVNIGLVQKLSFADSAKYQLQSLERADSHYHHLICTGCHKTMPLPYCPLDDLEAKLQKNTGFLPLEHKIEIYGYCESCRHKKGF